MLVVQTEQSLHKSEVSLEFSSSKFSTIVDTKFWVLDRLAILSVCNVWNFVPMAREEIALLVVDDSIWALVLEFGLEFFDLWAVADVFGRAQTIVLCLYLLIVLGQFEQCLSFVFSGREELLELKFKVAWVIKSSSVLGALQVEPKDRVHHASIVQHTVLQCLLHQTVDIIFFEGSTFVWPLHWWLIEKVHFVVAKLI